MKKNINLISNGVEWNDVQKELSGYQDLIRSIQVTLDGSKEIHDRFRPNILSRSSFDSIISALPSMLDLFQVNLRIHVFDQNIERLPELLNQVMEYKKKYGDRLRPYLFPITIFNAASTLSDSEPKNIRQKEVSLLRRCLEKLSDVDGNDNFEHISIDFPGAEGIWKLLSGKRFQIRHHYCNAHTNQYVIGPTGDIYKCWWGAGNKEFSIGSTTIGLDATADKHWKNRTVDRIDQCQECKFKFLCGGGCSYKAHLVNKSIYTPLCAEFDAIAALLIGYKYKGDGNVLRIY